MMEELRGAELEGAGGVLRMNDDRHQLGDQPLASR